MDALQDIIDRVNIQTNFTITYLDTELSEIPTELAEVMQELPQLQQEKYLGSHIRNFLYNFYFKGDDYHLNSPSDLNFDSELSDKSESNPKIIENNRIMGRDWEFYKALQDNNAGKGYEDPNWQVLKAEADGSFAVKKQGLTLHIQPEKHLPANAPLPAVGDSISVLMPCNLLEQGYYIAVSDRGLPTEPTVCIYFNFDAAGAIALMQSITQAFNPLEIPFSFKVLSAAESYWRYDSGILTLQLNDYGAINSILYKTYQKYHAHFQNCTPIFTKVLLPGLSIAETPLSSTSQTLNFGMHRCQIVAQGLLDAWLQGDNSAINRQKLIHQSFDRAKISWKSPYLNPNSEDIYLLSATDLL
jgi:hypothetical protein